MRDVMMEIGIEENGDTFCDSSSVTEKDVAMPFVLNCFVKVGCPICFLF